MSRRDELAKGIQKTTEPMADQKQVYPSKQPDLPARATVAIKSTPHFTVTRLGIQAATGGTEEEYNALGDGMFATVKALPWIWGDYMVIGSDMQWGAYKRIAEELGMEWRTLQEYAYVCRNVHLSLRHDKLSFSHHRAVADIYDEDNPEETRKQQRTALDYAVEHKLSVMNFRELLNTATIESPDASDSPAPVIILQPVVPVPFYEKPIDRVEKIIFKKWDNATDEERAAVLTRFEALIKTLKQRR